MISIKSFPQNAKFRYLSWHLSKKNDKKSIEQFYNLHKEKNQAGHSFWKNMTFEKCENKEYQVYFTNEDSNLVLKFGDELKFVYPQPNFNPKTFEKYDFDHYYIQPMDGNHYHKNEKISKEFINDNPNWKLSLQTHKILGFP